MGEGITLDDALAARLSAVTGVPFSLVSREPLEYAWDGPEFDVVLMLTLEAEEGMLEPDGYPIEIVVKAGSRTVRARAAVDLARRIRDAGFDVQADDGEEPLSLD